MRKVGVLLAILALGAAVEGFTLTPQEALQKITWFGQNSLRIELGGALIWIDEDAWKQAKRTRAEGFYR